MISPTHDTNNYLNMMLFNRLRPKDLNNDDSILAFSDDLLADDSNIDVFSLEYLNQIVLPNFPNHSIPLKNGAVYMSLVNLNADAHIQNGTRFLYCSITIVLDLLVEF